MAIIESADAFTAAVTKALRDNLAIIIEQEAVKANAAIRRRLHEAVGEISLSVLERYDITMRRGELTIRVLNEQPKP